MEFFTADHHFNHANIIKFCSRPFDDVLEMNEILIKNWNKVVKPKDTVYHLGDLGFGEFRYILERLNGKIILIRGSHDKSALAYQDIIDCSHNLLEINIEGQPIVLCHYCFRIWARSHYNSWHLYGHSHGRLEPIGKSWDVGVDNNNFTPLSFTQIKKIMAKQPDNPNLIKENNHDKR